MYTATIESPVLFRTRQQAGWQLSKKLVHYASGNAVVIGIPEGGAQVAHGLAKNLQLPLDVMPCRNIHDPADTAKSIGAVSLNDTFLKLYPHDLPQDFMFHRLSCLKQEILEEQNYYYDSGAPSSLLYKTVILVDDVLIDASKLMVCLQRNQKPLRVIVAVPVISADVQFDRLYQWVDELLFLHMEPEVLPSKYFEENIPIGKEEVRVLLKEAKNGRLD